MTSKGKKTWSYEEAKFILYILNVENISQLIQNARYVRNNSLSNTHIVSIRSFAWSISI